MWAPGPPGLGADDGEVVGVVSESGEKLAAEELAAQLEVDVRELVPDGPGDAGEHVVRRRTDEPHRHPA